MIFNNDNQLRISYSFIRRAVNLLSKTWIPQNFRLDFVLLSLFHGRTIVPFSLSIEPKFTENKFSTFLFNNTVIIIIAMIFRTHNKPFFNVLSAVAYCFTQELNGFEVFPLEHYEEGQRLDRYLKATAIGWSSAQKHLRNGNIKVLAADGTIIKNNGHKFQPGDRLLLRQGLGLQQLLIGDKNINHIEMDFNLAKNKLDDMLIFDNENITIVNKPQGYSVQGGGDPQHNLFSLMAARFRKEMVYISHRLDKPTTGIVLLPKNLKTAQLLGKALEAREGMDKYYLALTEGSEIRENKGTITCHIEWTNKHKARISEQIAGNERSQQAQTMFMKLSQKKLSDILWRHCLALKLVTGRKHQIRCQLAQYFLNPIINDELYLGRKYRDCDEAIFLHAFGLRINDQSIIRQVLRLQNTERQIVSKSGTLLAGQNQVTILANQPAHWLRAGQNMSNQGLLNVIAQFGSEKKTASRKKNTTLKIV